MRRQKWKKAGSRAVALTLSLALLLTVVLGGTLAYVLVKTPPIRNVFTSGIDPTGDVTVRKQVEHPFGNSYPIPAGLLFDFQISLGDAYADKAVQTTAGEKLADSNGVLTLQIPANGAVRLYDLIEGTVITVTELAKPGFTPDSAAKTLTVTRGENTLLFTNSYAPKPVTPVNLTVTGTKVLTGRPWQEGDSFAFALEYKLPGETDWKELSQAQVRYELIEVPVDPQPTDATQTTETTAATTAAAVETVLVPKPDFDKFSFTEAVQAMAFDKAGIWSFRVSEVDGSIGGITYDHVISYFDVLTGDADMDGALEIQAVTGYQNAESSRDESTDTFGVHVTVNNTYAPAGSARVVLKVNKTVSSNAGTPPSAAGYVFELYNEAGELVRTTEQTSAAGETVLELTYQAEDAGKTFLYQLKEKNAGKTLNAVTYDEKVYALCVSVEDNLDGTVSAYIWELTETEAPETTEPAEPTDPTAVTDPTEATEPVEVTDPTEATEPVEVTDPTEVTEPVEVTDPTEVTEPVEVTEPTEITNPTEVTAPTEEETPDPLRRPAEATGEFTAAFENRYDPADAQLAFVGSKILQGSTLREDQFRFLLHSADASFRELEQVTTAANNADGSFGFAPLTYSQVGTYYYTVREDASNKLGGITYDSTVYCVTVTVTDKDGVLTAELQITDGAAAADGLTFTNTYQASPVEVILGGKKQLQNAQLQAGDFRFVLYPSEAGFQTCGEALDTAANGSDGSFRFDKLRYDAPGEHYYLIAEDDSAPMDYVTYDDARYGVLVSVTDDGQGQLNAAVSYWRGEEQVTEAVFVNTYTPPTQPSEPEDTTAPEETTEPTEPTKPVDPDSPDTGDRRDPTAYLLTAAVSFTALGALLLCRRRKETNS